MSRHAAGGIDALVVEGGVVRHQWQTLGPCVYAPPRGGKIGSVLRVGHGDAVYGDAKTRVVFRLGVYQGVDAVYDDAVAHLDSPYGADA